MSDDVKIETPKEKPAFTHKSDAGKGDAPRNISERFRRNYDEIDWKKDGNPVRIKIKVDDNTTLELEPGWLKKSFESADKSRENEPEWSKGRSSVYPYGKL